MGRANTSCLPNIKSQKLKPLLLHPVFHSITMQPHHTMNRDLQYLGSWAQDHTSPEIGRGSVTEQALESTSTPNNDSAPMAPAVKPNQPKQTTSQCAAPANTSSSSTSSPGASSERFAMHKWHSETVHDQPWSVFSQRSETCEENEVATSEATYCKDAEAAR
ncbi:MAG: hypothetical protein Q9160_003808 [Pyrenula sp. 1 TL-2023]